MTLRRSIIIVVGIVLGVVVLALFITPFVSPVHESARRAQCTNGVKAITRAILEYEAVHGQLPPPYTMDANGQRLHSWRVLILPFLGEKQLYDEIDLTQPWNAPRNLRLQDRMPICYHCPSFTDKSPEFAFTTGYVVVVGDNTAWPRGGQRITNELIDEGAKTLAVLETEQHRVHWMSPNDPNFEAIESSSGGWDKLISGSMHNGGVCYGRLDGGVAFIVEDEGQRLRSMATIDHREEVPNR